MNRGYECVFAAHTFQPLFAYSKGLSTTSYAPSLLRRNKMRRCSVALVPEPGKRLVPAENRQNVEDTG